MSTTAVQANGTDKAGAWAVIAGAAIWGLFWIPLRYLEQTGIPGLWAIAMVLAAAGLPAFCVTVVKGEFKDLATPDGWIVGAALGLATVLYFTAVLYTDVIRAIFLFYLLPLWTTISARVVYGEPIRQQQLWVIAAALIGVWLLLGGGFALPLPHNAGDWCAIASGFCWGVSLSLLRGKQDTPAYASTTATVIAGCLLASLCAILLQSWDSADTTSNLVNESKDLLKTVPLAAAFGAAVLFPSMLGQIWGARRIPAPTAALLTMVEILVATSTAAWLVGTELTMLSMLGGGIIVLAVCIDLNTQRNQLTNKRSAFLP